MIFRNSIIPLLLGASLCLCFALIPVVAIGAPSGAVSVNPLDLYVTGSGKSQVVCAYLNGGWVPGKRLSGAENLFLPYSTDAKNKKKALQKASGKKRDALLRKSRKVKKLQKAAGAVCKREAPERSGSPTPTPLPNDSNFDSSGNVTDAGKLLFGIPSGLAANVSVGKQVYEANCIGCHEARVNRTFGNLRFNTAREPMFFNEQTLPDSDLANLTAYLNRFRL